MITHCGNRGGWTGRLEWANKLERFQLVEQAGMNRLEGAGNHQPHPAGFPACSEQAGIRAGSVPACSLWLDRCVIMAAALHSRRRRAAGRARLRWRRGRASPRRCCRPWRRSGLSELRRLQPKLPLHRRPHGNGVLPPALDLDQRPEKDVVGLALLRGAPPPPRLLLFVVCRRCPSGLSSTSSSAAPRSASPVCASHKLTGERASDM